MLLEKWRIGGMLEGSESFLQDMYDMGFCEGFLTGMLNADSLLKRRSKGLEYFDDKRFDIKIFKLKYPNLSNELLSKTIWRESEYWHGSYFSRNI
jgi:hypothetical protein